MQPIPKEELGKSVGEISDAYKKFLQSVKTIDGKEFQNSGQKIVSFLSKGVKLGGPETQKAIEALAELIASFFPRSPAKVGPLRYLVGMGAKIVGYLVSGITGAFGLAKSAIERLANLFAEPLQKAADLGEFSKNIGISVQSLSSLEFAMNSVGGSVDEMQFLFQRLNETLGKNLTYEEMQKFSKLGIDINSAVMAQEPAIALFQQFSDKLQGLTPDTLEWKEALELLGLTGNSKVINLLRLGSQEIQNLQKEGVKLGATISPAFAEGALKVRRLQNQLTRFKETIINDVIAPILPVLEESLARTLGFLQENSIMIGAVINFTMQALKILET
jgi:hypothetical protein